MLQSTRISIIGLGLMGGSLGLALRGRCARVAGWDARPEVTARAVERGAVEAGAGSLAEAVDGADVVVLAAPVRESLRLIEDLGGLVSRPIAVLDLCSTKSEVVRAMAALPQNFDPVGGHPMCGKERGGIENAEHTLFRGAAFAFTALDRTSPRLRSFAEELARAVRARPVWIEAERHDHAVAIASHLPYLLGATLVDTVEEGGQEARRLAGPGYRDTTRLAASDPRMMLDILVTNRGPVLLALRAIQERLAGLADLMADDESGLRQHLSAIRDRRAGMFPDRPPAPAACETILWPGA